MIEHFLKKSQLLTRGKGNAPPQRSKFITKDESHLNSLENLHNKTSIKISSYTGSRLGRISSYIASLRLILVSLLFASNAYAQISPTAFIDLEYFYDGVGNITSITDRIDSQNSCTMQYDSLDRLITADGPWGVGSFTYDSVGNRTSKDIAGENINYSYGADNRLSGVVHDANGNIIDDGTFTYTYDSEKRLIQVTNGVDVTTYEYDGDGRRIKRVTNGETTYYAYGVGLNVLTEFSGLRIPKHDYIYAGNKNIARVNYDGSGVKQGKTFYHSDHLGSNIAITDATSTVEWDRVYLPYGGEFNDPNFDHLPNTHQYTAKELDEDIGLYYYGARYYNPVIGRFMSVDPAGGDHTDPQSFNKYAYVQNNPFTLKDPDGEIGVICDAASEFGNIAAQISGGAADLLVAYGKIGVRNSEYIYLDALRKSFDKFSFITGFCSVRGLAKRGAFKLGAVAGKVDNVGEVLTNTSKKPIVIGENMKDRVIPAAKELGADVYEPRSKIKESWLKNNVLWLKQKMKEGREIIDIGPDPKRPVRSPFYEAEKQLIEKSKYPTTKP